MSSQDNKYKLELNLLAQDALRDIEKLPAPILQFCGPISTGGFGNVVDNLDCMRSYINRTRELGLSVFDQIKYERRMDSILKAHTGYDFPLLDFFYKTILSSGKIDGLIFLPLWETSTGSSWEHDFAKTMGIPILYIDNMLVDEIRSFHNSLKLDTHTNSI